MIFSDFGRTIRFQKLSVALKVFSDVAVYFLLCNSSTCAHVVLPSEIHPTCPLFLGMKIVTLLPSVLISFYRKILDLLINL